MIRPLQVSLVALALLLSLPVTAANYTIYVPSRVQSGAETVEVYVPKFFEAHDGLAGRALVDASWKELSDALPKALKRIQMMPQSAVKVALTASTCYKKHTPIPTWMRSF